MKTSSSVPPTLRFGVFELDPRAGELRKKGMKIRLQGQPVEILAMLLQRPGETITREELQKKLWPADTFVDFEQGLNNAMKRLRAALDDDAESPHFIETLPRHGYRFIGSVNGSVQALTAEAGSPALQISRWLRFPWSALAASVVLAALVLWSVSRTGPLPPKIAKAETAHQQFRWQRSHQRCHFSRRKIPGLCGPIGNACAIDCQRRYADRFPARVAGCQCRVVDCFLVS